MFSFTFYISLSQLYKNGITALSDASADGIKGWLESILAQGGLTAEEQALVDWQNNSENMTAALDELKAIEDKGNFKLTLETK
ncbi:DurN family substrate-assisted peptide maturase [Microcoleus sp. OTE_8_concoct_300]|uniref:DurN family substrate-assisted peptide maturase n=1 Tax=Microcoleus sp. OTE_8_concoct_300 TaxID=2964710 RepID=UPI00403F2CE2